MTFFGSIFGLGKCLGALALSRLSTTLPVVIKDPFLIAGYSTIEKWIVFVP